MADENESQEGTEIQEENTEQHEEKDDYAELKGALDKERQARKAAERNLTAAKNAAEKTEQEALEKNQQFEELWKKSDTELQTLRATVETKEVSAAIGKVIGGVTKNTDFAEALGALYTKNAKYENGEVVFLWDGMSVTADQLADNIKTARPGLVDGNQSSGGDANGNTTAGSGTGIFKTQEQLDALHPAEKMKFFRDGGQIKN